MNGKISNGWRFWHAAGMKQICALLVGAALASAPVAWAGAATVETPIKLAAVTAKKKTTKAPAKPTEAAKPAAPETPLSVEGAPMAAVTVLDVVVGRSNLVNLTANVSRVSVGDPKVANVILTGPRQIYILGEKLGSTNVMLWDKAGRMVAAIDVNVSQEFGALNSEIRKLVAKKGAVQVRPVGDAVVLEGRVSDSRLAARVSDLADALAGKKVVNMLAVDGVQQVMLEVKIAEINRTLGEQLGFDFARQSGLRLLTGIIGGNPGIYSKLGDPIPIPGQGLIVGGGDNNVTKIPATPPIPAIFNDNRVAFGTNDHLSTLIDAAKRDGLVKILAEPNIVAMSGQEGSFLAGGEIFIPVPQALGVTTLESRQFGVGLRFTPTVLEDGRISMRVLPEVTELAGFTTVGNSVIPTLTTRRTSTSVELRDGQSLAIGGLLQDNVRQAIKRFPILGEIPVLGTLFRSSEYQTDKTELLIVVTPRLIKPLAANYSLPTDAFKEPSRSEFFLEGRMEGKPASETAQPAAQPAPAADGHQLK